MSHMKAMPSTNVTAAAAAAADPYQLWLQRIKRVMNEQECQGWMTLRGTDEIDYDEMSVDSDEDMSDAAPYKTWEVDYIRVVLMPPARERAVEKMKKKVLGAQYKKSLLIDPATLAKKVLTAFSTMESEFKKKRMWSKKFNILFGFTYNIAVYDAWVEANIDGNMNGMLDSLVEMWERVMEKPAADLGIDEEFTLPAVRYFLRTFQDNLVI